MPKWRMPPDCRLDHLAPEHEVMPLRRHPVDHVMQQRLIFAELEIQVLSPLIHLAPTYRYPWASAGTSLQLEGHPGEYVALNLTTPPMNGRRSRVEVAGHRDLTFPYPNLLFRRIVGISRAGPTCENANLARALHGLGAREL